MRDKSELTLRNQKDFARIYNRGKSRGSKYVVVLYRKNNLDYTRTAFVSSKKVGNSVCRNRARRLMRESYRSFQDRVVKGMDIIMVARNTINGVCEGDVQRSLYGTMKSCGLIEGK
jgi:ribonuclease P protein component